jgi:glutamyl-tRNA synthetase
MSEQKISSVVTRFAPSPTGFMHVGGVRTALYAYAWAKKNGGKFILRIEDTDKAREVAGSIDHIMDSLRWLGITWDEGPDIGGSHAPYIQSKRLESYKKYAQVLIDKGYAYVDPYSEEEVAAFRKKAEEEKRAFLFRDHRPENTLPWDGTRPLRFKVPEIKPYTWKDAVRGELHAGVEALDDFILIKSDGYPTYNFAHIIDDLEMGVTHIMRADEFIASTPKFLSLYEALEITPPVLVTLPPILGKEGTKKLGKRDGAKDILDYKKDGFLPEALVNFLALLGWNPGGEQEIFTMEELVTAFNIDRIHSSGAMLNEQKLLWINKEHLKKEPIENILAAIAPRMPGYSTELLHRVAPVLVDRIAYYGELDQIRDTEFAFLINPPQNIPQEKIVWKDTTIQDACKHLEQIHTILTATTFSSLDAVKEPLMGYAEKHGKGNVLWPLRMTLSGQDRSIDPFTICYVLGKEETLRRIEVVLKQFLT